jgi:hypothetical protein
MRIIHSTATAMTVVLSLALSSFGATPGNDSPTTASPATEPAAAHPAIANDPPKLRFLSTFERLPLKYYGLIWTPDGTTNLAPADRQELIQTGSISDIPPGTPSGLHLWFSGSSIDLESACIASIEIPNSNGFRDSANNGRGSNSSIRPAGDGALGWLTTVVWPSEVIPVANITLRYSQGPWTCGATVAVDAQPDVSLGGGMQLLKIASEGDTVRVTLRCSTPSLQATQEDLVAELTNGTERASFGRGTSAGPQTAELDFQFRIKLGDVESFQLRSRPIRAETFQNVAMAPTIASTPKANTDSEKDVTPPTIHEIGQMALAKEIDWNDLQSSHSVLSSDGQIVLHIGGELDQAPDGTMSGRYSWRLWDLSPTWQSPPAAPEETNGDSGDGRPLNNAAIADDGSRAIGASLDWGTPTGGSLWIYDLADPGPPKLLIHKTVGGFGKLAISGDCERALVDDQDGSLSEWDLANGKVLHQFRSCHSPLPSLIYSADGKEAIGGAWFNDNSVHIWDIDSGKEIGRLQGAKGQFCLAVSPDGRLLASGSDDDIVTLWNLATKQKQTVFQGYNEAPAALVFSPNGALLASITYGNGKPAEVKVWNIGAGALVIDQTVDTGLEAVAFDRSGNHLIVAAPAKAYEFNVPDIGKK